METTHLIQTPPTTDLMTLSDCDLAGFFASFGLDVEVVAHCDAPGCFSCSSLVAERAA